MTGLFELLPGFDLSAFAEAPQFVPLLAEATASQTLAIVVWVGLAILTVALLILMQTRWGQAQPLSKCVVLSVFAHILFFAYAYGTRLIFDAPAPENNEVIRLAFVSHDAETVSTPRELRPWNEYPAEFAITPDIASPGQQYFEVETSVPPSTTEPPDFAVVATEPRISTPDIQEFIPTPPSPQAETFMPAEPSAIEVVQSEPTSSTEPLPALPAAEPLERLAPEPQVQPMGGTNGVAEVPKLLPESETLQRLADVDFSKDIAEARPSTFDMAVPADNRDANTQHNGNEGGAADRGLQAQIAPAESSLDSGMSAPARRLGDGAPLPEVYQMRMARRRMALIEQQGGSEQTEQAVEAALKWLAAHQSPDGRWSAVQFGGGQETKVLGHDRKGAGMDADNGITGLALLTFLSAGHTHFEGEYRRTVQHGLEFILGQQAQDGNLAGQARLFARMYCHGMATLAISEAYAMTGDHRMRTYVERAVQYTIKAQDSGTGGWRYQPADQGDMSQFGWQVMALKSAELAGITVPGESRAGMIRFLRSVSKGEHRGLASYRPTERASETMTAEALACRYFLNIQQDETSVQEAIRYIGQMVPSGGQANLYYWYYGTIALFQSRFDHGTSPLQLGEMTWSQWNHALQEQLLVRQERSGENAGSFSPETVWGAYGGRVYSTAMATLCLEVYYRYLPVYELGPAAAAASRETPNYRVLR
ncbi:MAG: hypothetical protein H6822_36200 [Planctomycetaceae bacterium]|nr:hypothetical protein [Planctomycetales bacterium]MCB9927631.1 hypothetical protein [Planctomycetaceae bacterium]